MAEFPALPLFTDALIADTEHLTNEEFGAYVRLLMVIWRNANCQIPADAEWHMRRLRVNQQEYSRLYQPLIKEFLKSDGNFISQKRLQKEFSYLRETRGKQSANAKSRWNKQKPVSGGTPPHPTPPHPTPPLTDINVGQPVDFKKVIFDEGLRWISTQAGRTPTTMRGLLGKWCKQYGDAAVAGVLVRAQTFSPVEPISFVEKMLKEEANAKSGNARGSGGAASKSERFKQAIIATTLADIEADGRPGGEEKAGKPPGLLL